MPRMKQDELQQHEKTIYYICVSQGVPKQNAVFFAKVFQPLTNNPNKSATQRELADWAGISPPAAMRHVRFFLGQDRGLDPKQGWVLVRDHYRKYRLHPNWRTNLTLAYRESLKKQYLQAIHT